MIYQRGKLIIWLRTAWQWHKLKWKWLGDNKDQLTILFAVIAAGYVLYEYRGNQDASRIARTMEFATRYSEKELLGARIALDNVLFDEGFDKKRAATGLKGNDAISKIITDMKLDSNVRLLADFFGQVATCMKNSLCDIGTTCAAFRQGTKELRNNYYGLFARWEKAWNTNLIEPTYQYFEMVCGKKP